MGQPPVRDGMSWLKLLRAAGQRTNAVKRLGRWPGRGSAAVMARVPVGGLLWFVYGRRLARPHCLVDLSRELTGDDQVYAPGDPDSPQEIAAAAAVHAEMESWRRALVPELGSRLGGQVAAGSSGTGIFLYASGAGSADEAARVAREVLARHDVSAPVRIERWSSGTRSGWMRRTSRPPMSLPSSRLSTNTFRSTSGNIGTTGRPAWQIRVRLPSHRDAVALAGHLAAQGWQVRPLRKDLIVWADCEDDAKDLDRALSGDAYTAFRVRRVSYGRNIPPGLAPQGPLIFGP